MKGNRDYLNEIDTKTTGNRYDVTPLFSNYQNFNALINDLVSQVPPNTIDIVACIDALGFILGTAIAQKLEVGVLAIRKGGKLPVDTDQIEFRDYSGLLKKLEMRRDILTNDMSVLIVDEWIETGAQINSAVKLIEDQGAVVMGVMTIRMDDNEATRSISSRYDVYSVM